MRSKLAAFLLMLVPFAVQGQRTPNERHIDSLLTELARSRPDTNKVKLLDQVSYAYSPVDPVKGVTYGEQAKQLAESLGWKKGMAIANFDIAKNYSVQSHHSKARHHYLQALKLYEELGLESSVAGVLANISLNYLAQSDYPHALEYAFRALEIYEALKSEQNIALMQENIGTIYQEQKKYDEAMTYYSGALVTYRQAGSKNDVARVLGNIAIVHDANGDYARALDLHLQALETNLANGKLHSAQINMTNVGIVHSHMKNFSKALYYQMMALRTSEEFGMERDIAVNLGNIGETYFFIATDTSGTTAPDSLVRPGKAANLQQAIFYLEKAVAGCRALKFNGPLIEFTKFLSDAYSLAGDHQKACEAFKEHIAVRDSVFSQQATIRLNDLESQRELDLKDKEIIIRDKQLEIVKLEAANRRSERVIYISGIVLLLGVAGVVIARSARRSKAHKNVLSDIADIQSHDIRGPVARILGLVRLFNHKDPADPVNKDVIALIEHVSVELDETVKRIVTKTTGEEIHDQPHFPEPKGPENA